MTTKLRHLEVFRAVMAAGSATGAAAMLKISQPAVSQLLAQLERQAGLALFARRGGRLVPTWEAQALFTEVDRAFSGIDRLARVIAGLRGHDLGHVNVASFPGLVGRLLPDIVAAYRLGHPEVEVALEVRRSRDLPEMVLTREVDFAVTLLPSERDEIASVRIGEMAAVCLLHAGHRLARRRTVRARDLQGEDFISLGRGDPWRHAVDRVFAGEHVDRRMQIESAQTEAACSFVGAGCGVAVVDPISLYRLQDPRVRVRPFEPAVMFELWLLRPRAVAQSMLAEDLGRFVHARLERFLSAAHPCRFATKTVRQRRVEAASG